VLKNSSFAHTAVTAKGWIKMNRVIGLTLFVLLVGVSICFCPAAWAQESKYDVKKFPSAVSDEFSRVGDKIGEIVNTIPMESTFPTATPSAQESEPGKGREFFAVPIPTSNPMFGVGVTAMAGCIFRPDKNDTVSPPSTIAVGGMYTENETWAAGGGAKIFLYEDTLRLLAGGGYADLKYDFYGTGNDLGDAGKSIPLNQVVKGGVLESLFRLNGKTFLGPRFVAGNSLITRGGDDIVLADGSTLPRAELDVQTNTIGAHLQQDTRDSQFYAVQGHVFDFQVDFSEEAFGSDFNYQIYSTYWNGYKTLSKKQVLAVRGYGKGCDGRVPFFMLPSFGSGSDLRGYPAGRYRDKAMVAAQAEYRLVLNKFLGMVVFGGAGEVASSWGDFNQDNILPSYGIGARFTVAPKNHLNMRLDYAVGKDDAVWYLAVAEAF